SAPGTGAHETNHGAERKRAHGKPPSRVAAARQRPDQGAIDPASGVRPSCCWTERCSPCCGFVKAIVAPQGRRAIELGPPCPAARCTADAAGRSSPCQAPPSILRRERRISRREMTTPPGGSRSIEEEAPCPSALAHPRVFASHAPYSPPCSPSPRQRP